MSPEISSLLGVMRVAAAESFYAAERFGKDSPQHLKLMEVYSSAAAAYETACRVSGIAAYHTYDEG